MSYSNNDNLLIQSYFTTALLAELTNAKFIESDYYKSVQFEDKFVQDNLPKVGIDNQGTLLMVLYTLLVVPRQILEKSFPIELEDLNSVVANLSISATSTYTKDAHVIDHVRHLRNAVAPASPLKQTKLSLFVTRTGMVRFGKQLFLCQTWVCCLLNCN